MKKRLDNLDIVKGIAIILVVWAHADRRMDFVFFQDNLKLAGDIINSFHIATLFLVSGVLFRNTLEHGEMGALLTRAVKSILLPFLMLNAAFMVMNLLAPEDLLKSPTALQMLQGVTYLQSSDLMPSGVLWFLFVLFTSMCLTVVLHKGLGAHLWQIALLGVAIKLASPLLDEVHVFAAGKFSRCFVFFIGGVLFSPLLKDATRSRRAALVGLGYVLLFVPCFAFKDVCKPIMLLGAGAFGSAAMLVAGAFLAGSHNRLVSFLKYCGMHSMLIFVFHMPFFTFIRPLIKSLDLLSSFAGFGLWVSLGVLLPLALGNVLARVPAFYGLLLGRPPYTMLHKETRSI